VEAELTSLAVSGATTLVQLMAGDAWATTKSQVKALFGRGPSQQSQAVEAELEGARAELVAAQSTGDQAAVAEIQARWQTRLLLLLQNDPAAAGALRALITHSAERTSIVHNTISGGDVRGPVIQTSTINGDLHFG
jgi:hypothetical protein